MALDSPFIKGNLHDVLSASRRQKPKNRSDPFRKAVPMKRVGDHRFLQTWQVLRAASQPAADATEWRIGAVEWQRHRTSLLSGHYSVVLEVHRLEHTGGGDRWSFLVVSEVWWGADHQVLRSQLWASHISGAKLAVHQWLQDQVERLAPGAADRL